MPSFALFNEYATENVLRIAAAMRRAEAASLNGYMYWYPYRLDIELTNIIWRAPSTLLACTRDEALGLIETVDWTEDRLGTPTLTSGVMLDMDTAMCGLMTVMARQFCVAVPGGKHALGNARFDILDNGDAVGTITEDNVTKVVWSHPALC